MKRLRDWFLTNWFALLLTFIGSAFLATLLWLRLDTLLPGVSASEATQNNLVASLSNIIRLPSGIYQSLPQLAAIRLGLNNIIALRGVSTLIGVTVIWSAYYVLRTWYTERLAIIGAFSFATAAWFLQIARNGSPSITYSLLFVAFAVFVWIKNSRASVWSVLSGACITLALVYTPGMIWFLVPLMAWRFKWLTKVLKKQNTIIMALLIFVSLLAVVPLLLSFYKDPALLKPYLGVPVNFAFSLDVIKNIALVPARIFVYNSSNYEFGLGILPFVNWFMTVVFVIGCYAHFYKRSLDRTWTLLYVFVVGSILIGLQGPVNMSLLLPFVYFIAISGIGLLLQQWFTIFPINPFARSIGLIFIILAVLSSSYYELNKYYVAWPNTPMTKQVFDHKI